MQRLRNYFKKTFKRSEVNGFALVVALLANMVLLAFCVLSVWIATKDIRISSRMVGEKMALDAAEAGLHTLISNFDPNNVTASAATNVQIDPGNPHSLYSATVPARPTTGPVMVPLPGYSIGGGQQWGQTRYNTTVTGTNDLYKTKVDIDVGIGYGPIEMTSMYR
jgi:Tfp pilus assembly protein PilX